MKREEGEKTEPEKMPVLSAGSKPPTVITIPPVSEPLTVEEN
jgi:hypothetical protein